MSSLQAFIACFRLDILLLTFKQTWCKLYYTMHPVLSLSQSRIVSVLTSFVYSEFLGLTLTFLVQRMRLDINAEILNYATMLYSYKLKFFYYSRSSAHNRYAVSDLPYFTCYGP